MLVGELFCQLFNPFFLASGAGLLVDTGVAWVARPLQVVDQLISRSDNVVHLGLLGQNLITEGEQTCITLPLDKTTSRVTISDFVNHEAAIPTSREEPIVVETKSHSLDRLAMGLHLAEHLHGKLPDLYRTRVTSLTDTREEGLSVG